MVIFKGQDDGTGASNDPIVYTGVTLTFTGTLRAFFQRKYLSDFTITSVEGTFVSQSASGVIAQNQIIGSMNADTADHDAGTDTVTLTGGDGSGAQASVQRTGATGFATITSVIITAGGTGFAVGNTLTIPGGSPIGGTAQTLTLTISDMLPTYTTQVVDLKQVYMDAEDALDTSGNLIFTVHNTLDHDLNYKYSFVVRIYNTL